MVTNTNTEELSTKVELLVRKRSKMLFNRVGLVTICSMLNPETMSKNCLDRVQYHSSRRSQAVLLRNGNEAIFRLESSIAQTCKTNKQKISIYHLGRLEIFMHELRKHLVF